MFSDFFSEEQNRINFNLILDTIPMRTKMYNYTNRVKT